MFELWGENNEECVKNLAPWPGKWSPPVLGYDWWIFTICMAIFMLIARHILNETFFRPIATIYVGGGLTSIHSKVEFKRGRGADAEEKGSEALRPEVLINKFIKYEWHLLFYCLMWPSILYLLYVAKWSIFNNYDAADLGIFSFDAKDAIMPSAFKHDETDHCEVTIYIRLIYAIEFAWYLHGVVETVVFDSKRGDFLMMIAHHIMAGAIIFLSLCAYSHRYGMYILAVMDVADIVLYAAKIFHLSTSNVMGRALNSNYRKGQSIALVCVGVVWTVFRMILLTILISQLFYLPYTPGGWFQFMRVIVSCLTAMQWVWGILCWRMVFTQITKGEFDDIVHDDKKIKKEK